jgi:hypothetical protein
LNGVTMRGPHISNTSTGTLVITGHHLIFSSISEDVELWVNNDNLLCLLLESNVYSRLFCFYNIYKHMYF